MLKQVADITGCHLSPTQNENNANREGQTQELPCSPLIINKNGKALQVHTQKTPVISNNNKNPAVPVKLKSSSNLRLDNSNRNYTNCGIYLFTGEGGGMSPLSKVHVHWKGDFLVLL